MAIALRAAVACVIGIALATEARPTAQTDAFRGRVVRDAAIAPDGTWVAFTRSEVPIDSKTPPPISLWRIPFAGGDAQRLTTTLTQDSHPRWSSDGSQIAFLSAALGANAPARVFTMPANARAARAITPESIDVVTFQWSPSGRRIAFVSGRATSPALWVMDADGSNQRRLNDGVIAALAWSPDERAIARVWRPSLDSVTLAEIVDVAAATVPRAMATDVLPRVSWSSDGGLALLGRHDTGPSTLLVQQPGREARELPIVAPGNITDVAWIGDGRLSLTFASNAETWIERLTIATGERIAVMPPGIASLASTPSWSIDGNRYVVVGSTQEHGAEVFAGTIPLPETGLPDTVGARPPPVRRITFSDR